MPTYGPWTTYTGLRQSAVIAPVWIRALYGALDTEQELFGTGNTWSMVQSFAAHAAGELPHTYSSARTCCLTHAAEGESGTQQFWDPGECDALTSPAYGGFVSVAKGHPVPVGTTTTWQGPPLYLLPATYRCSVMHTGGSIYYIPLWYDLGQPPETGPRSVHSSILAQIPGFIDAVAADLEPDVEILRIDGEAHLSVDVPQSRLANATTVTAHTRTGVGLTPTSALGPVAMTVPATLGSESATITIPDLQPGDVHAFDFASSRVRSGLDPGQMEENLAEVTWVTDFVWQVRARFQVSEVINVCRWLQRDDGLGVTAAGRARTGTSLQRGNRFRGYR